MLLIEDAGRECGGIIVVAQRDCPLDDDRAGVEVLVDEVDGAAGDAHAVIDRLLLSVDPGE